jgi:hypothetical protein
MGCSHDRLRTVGDRVFCCDCQEELSLEFLMGKNGENRTNNPAPAEEKDKPTSRKRTAKKAV